MFASRIHESCALASLLAGSVALHIAWMDNLLIHRSRFVRDILTLNPDIGPISGLYLDTLGAFFVLLIILTAFWRGKDVSHWRERVFWFFILSIAIFLLMTLPFVYGFAIS